MGPTRGRLAATAIVAAMACNSDPTEINGPGVLVTPPSVLATSELGDELTFEVVLTGEPSNTVTVPLQAVPAEEGQVEPAELVFTPGNWDQPQSFIVRGVDDEADDGVRSFTVFLDPLISADGDYAGLDLGDYMVSNYDDEVAVELFDPADEMAPPNLLIFEGFIGMDGVAAPLGTSIGVRLTDPPRTGTDVAIELALTGAEGDASFAADNPDALTLGLTFDENNFADTQIVDIASFDDGSQDTGTISLSFQITSADPVYAPLTLPTEELVQVDDDTASISMSPRMSTVCEGATRVINIALSTVPQDDVTIGLDVPAGRGLRAGPPVVLGGNDLTGKIAITAGDDDIEQGDEVFTIDSTVTTTDPVYSALAGGSITLTVIDNDGGAGELPDEMQPLALQLCPLDPTP